MLVAQVYIGGNSVTVFVSEACEARSEIETNE